MKPFLRWIVRHKAICLVIVMISSVIISNLLSGDSLLPYLVLIAAATVAFTFVILCAGILMKQPTQLLFEKCDPASYIEETALLLDGRLSKTDMAVMLMNHAVGLRYMGEYARAYEIMHSIDFKTLERVGFVYKIVFYNNIIAYCILLGRYDEADMWNSRLISEYNDQRSERMKKSVSAMYDGAIMYELIREERYAEALSVCGTLTFKNKLQSLSISIDRARIYRGLGDIEKAREQLNYVIENAHKTSLGTEAARMLESVDK